MPEFKRVRDYLPAQRSLPDPKPVKARTSPVQYVKENPEQEARAQRELLERAGKPLQSGIIHYDCGVCLDAHWLRADVPFGHKLFGKMTMCPCNSQFAQFGGRWF